MYKWSTDKEGGGAGRSAGTISRDNAYSLDRLLEWLLSRKDAAGKNPYASVLARQGIMKLGRTREEFAAMGRKGADARWNRRRQDAALSLKDKLPGR